MKIDVQNDRMMNRLGSNFDGPMAKWEPGQMVEPSNQVGDKILLRNIPGLKDVRSTRKEGIARFVDHIVSGNNGLANRPHPGLPRKPIASVTTFGREIPAWHLCG